MGWRAEAEAARPARPYLVSLGSAVSAGERGRERGGEPLADCGLCRCGRRAPLYVRQRPWRAAPGAAAITCGHGLLCAKDPARPRTCEIGAQRPALSRAPSLGMRAVRPTELGAAGQDLGPGQPWPAASSGPYLPTSLCLRHGPEHTGEREPPGRWHLSPPLPASQPPALATEPQDPCLRRPPGTGAARSPEDPVGGALPGRTPARRVLSSAPGPRAVWKRAGALQSWGDTVGTGEGAAPRGQLIEDPGLLTQTHTGAPPLSQAQGPQEGSSASHCVWAWAQSVPAGGGSWLYTGKCPHCSRTFLTCGERQKWWPESETDWPSRPPPVPWVPGAPPVPHPASAPPPPLGWSAPPGPGTAPLPA